VLYVHARDPIPWKSSRLFAPSMDTNDPRRPRAPDLQAYMGAGLFTYNDAMAISKSRQALHQAAMYAISQPVRTDDPSKLPVTVEGQATQADFFTMFDVPFRSGGPWGRAEDESRARVVVIGEELAAHFFPGINPVGRTLQVHERDFRIVGVTGKWAPFPAFYDPLGVTDAAKIRSGPQLLVPIETAVGGFLPTSFVGYANMKPPRSWAPDQSEGALKNYFSAPFFLQTQLWVELRSTADAQRYKQMLDDYAADWQRRAGFDWKPPTALRSMRQWLFLSPQTAAVRNEFELAAWVAFGFLLVCLTNAAALMVARFARRGGDLAVRRALGAPRKALVAQCLAETVVIGAAGGVAGLVVTLLGLQLERMSVPKEMIRALHLDSQLVLATMALAILVTVCAGLYPAWRASRTRGNWELQSL
jgi:putative ABC transport system permease protein